MVEDDEVLVDAFGSEGTKSVRRRLIAEVLQARTEELFETVLSDPVGARVSELAETARHGIHVVMVFIRIDSPDTSKQRVAMRVMQGGHDVPDEKLEAVYKNGRRIGQ